LGLAQAFLASLPFVDKPQKARHAYGLQEKLKPNPTLFYRPFGAFARFARKKNKASPPLKLQKLGWARFGFCCS